MRIATVAILALVASCSQDAKACSCIAPGPTPIEALQETDVVLLGRAVRTGVEAPKSGLEPGQRSSASLVKWTIEVEYVWKGDDVPAFDVWTFRTGASCGVSFKDGERFLVYANEFPFERLTRMWDFEFTEPTFVSNRCSRTSVVEVAQVDLVALPAPRAGHLRSVTGIQGWVEAQSADGRLKTSVPLGWTIEVGDSSIRVAHSVDGPKRPDFCDFKGEADSVSTVVDFDYTFHVIRRAEHEDSGWDIGPIEVAGLSGIETRVGAEGCGPRILTLYANEWQTIRVAGPRLAELTSSALSDELLSIPGVVSPERSDRIVAEIVRGIVENLEPMGDFDWTLPKD